MKVSYNGLWEILIDQDMNKKIGERLRIISCNYI